MVDGVIRTAGAIREEDKGATGPLLVILLIVAWALFHVVLSVSHAPPVFNGQLLGPDSYMRMVRIEALLDSGAWYDHQIRRSNAPLGEALHWTRPFDVLLIVVAAPFAMFVGWKTALFWAATAISPLLQLALAFAFAWAVAPMLRPGLWLLPTIALLVQPGIAAAGLAGRADHHALFLLVFLLQWAFLLRCLADRDDDRSPYVAGALVGFGIWLSTEFLFSAGLVTAGLAFAWLIDPEGRVRQNRRFATTFFLVLVAAFLVEYPPTGPHLVAMDKISLVHILISALLLGFWCLMALGASRQAHWFPSQVATRFCISGVATLLALSSLFLLTPNFFSGPMAEIDPRIVPIWLDHVQEMKDLLPRDAESLGKLIVYLGHLAISVPYLCWRIAKARTMEDRLTWLVLGAAITAFATVAVLHVRFAAFAEVLILIPLACFMNAAFAAAGRCSSDAVRGLLRGSVISILLIGPLMVGKVLAYQGFDNFVGPPAEASANKLCDIRTIAPYVDGQSNRRDEALTVLAFMDLGPQILYHTRHRVIGTPYHRNGAGIVHGHRMLATSNEEESHRLMMARGVDLILLCPDSAERSFYRADGNEDRLYQRLLDGHGPSWIVPLELPQTVRGSFMLFRTKLSTNPN